MYHNVAQKWMKMFWILINAGKLLFMHKLSIWKIRRQFKWKIVYGKFNFTIKPFNSLVAVLVLFHNTDVQLKNV